MTTRVHLLAIALSLGCDVVPDPNVSAPEDPIELHAWLLAGEYEAWESDRTVSPSEAGGGARVFVSPALADSLADGEPTHPAGAAAVREIYEPDLVSLRGWAAIVKREEVAPASAEAWLWFEVFGVDEDAVPQIAQAAAPGCITCHADGVDYVHSALPLR